jgi:hypothetical protein
MNWKGSERSRSSLVLLAVVGMTTAAFLFYSSNLNEKVAVAE